MRNRPNVVTTFAADCQRGTKEGAPKGEDTHKEEGTLRAFRQNVAGLGDVDVLRIILHVGREDLLGLIPVP